MDDLARLKKGHHAGDAYFYIHELEKTGHLALEVRWLKASDPRFCFSIDENLLQTPKSPKRNKGVCLQSGRMYTTGGNCIVLIKYVHGYKIGCIHKLSSELLAHYGFFEFREILFLDRKRSFQYKCYRSNCLCGICFKMEYVVISTGPVLVPSVIM
jgi:hypothetical protein